MTHKIIILDFGSQYTQLIARAVREANVYCEILPYGKYFELSADIKGVILSGSPCSVNDDNAPTVDVARLVQHVPVLGVCYGAQLTAKVMGGHVDKSNKREYGRAHLHLQHSDDVLLQGITEGSQVWMSHSDSIKHLP
ncbi:MAG TPA: GMP synthase (glutamine-hydrolyzing), partial [Chitinophagaceae bacterium]|nr:GMP synthase (glutamine-hydrolyzing) [Chitinophagaceae bacterium]